MSPAARNGEGERARILIVEDDQGIRDRLQYRLLAAGFGVLEASDGVCGLRLARTCARAEGPA